jgi:CCR4-NOT complex subunit CAF16
VTVDLDLLVRTTLLSFLRSESESRGATILYATHIFDGLSAMDFPTHVIHMRDGAIVGFEDGDVGTLDLYTLALRWLKEDWEERARQEKEGVRKKRGRRGLDVPSDSETFYKK